MGVHGWGCMDRAHGGGGGAWRGRMDSDTIRVDIMIGIGMVEREAGRHMETERCTAWGEGHHLGKPCNLAGTPTTTSLTENA